MKKEIEFFDINEVEPPETTRPLFIRVIEKGYKDEPNVEMVGLCKYGCSTLKNGKKVLNSYQIFDPVPSDISWQEGGCLCVKAEPDAILTVTHWAYFTI